MSPNDRRSLLANLAFIALLYLGLKHDVVVLTVLAIGWVWLMLALYLVVLASPSKRSIPPLRPVWLFRVLDVTALGILIWHGWVATAAAWIASIVVHDMACRRGPASHATGGRPG